MLLGASSEIDSASTIDVQNLHRGGGVAAATTISLAPVRRLLKGAVAAVEALTNPMIPSLLAPPLVLLVKR